MCSTDSEHSDLSAYNAMYEFARTLERELAAIKSAEMPEPVLFAVKCNGAFNANVRETKDGAQDVMTHLNKTCPNDKREIVPIYGPDLLVYAQRATAELDNERMKLAGCSTAAIGYWKEGDAIHPDYESTALHDVAALYQRKEKERERAEKAEAAAIPQNPCTCVPDGDDGTLAHLCEWHKAELGDALKIQRMADTMTVENALKMPPDKLRLFIAHGIMESTQRKKAETALDDVAERVRELISDDAYAATFQSMAQYRSALLRALDFKGLK